MARALPAQNKRKDMTEEQIKGLKPGDLLRETYEVQEVSEDYVILRYQSGTNFGMCTKDSPMARQAELVQPAPKFEVGDIVRVVPDPLTCTLYGNGQGRADLEDEVVKIIYPLRGGDLRVETKKGEKPWISIHCLALVKKAEKDRYKVEKDDINFCVMDGKWAVAHFSINTHPDAEAAAKAECARLNAEWRKEQEGKEGADHE